MKVRIKSEVLARRLASRNISQNRWAQILGISRSYLSMLLSGQRRYPGPDLRSRLLDRLDIRFEELFEVEGREGSGESRAPGTNRSQSGAADAAGLLATRKERIMRAMDDVRFSARILARNPGFSLLAVLTLALGIAAATAIFSFTNTLLWKPLPIPEDDRLVFLNEGHPGSGLKQVGVSYLNFSDWAESATSFESMAAYETTSFLMQAGPGSSSLVSGVAVSAGFFELLAVPPRMGSWLTSSPGADADTVVLGHDLWLSHLGGDPEIVGKSIVLDGISRKVVGVMPSTFRFPERHDLWVPLPRLASWDNRRARFLDVIAKLAPEVPLGRARQEMLTLTQQLREVYPESNQEFSLTMLPFREENVGEDDQLLVYSMPDQFPYWMDFSMDWRVYLFVAAVIAGSGLLFGLGPALKAAPHSGERILQASGNRAGGPGGGRLRKALIIGEVTMAMTLVTGAGLMMQTWLNSRRLDLGYDPSGVLTFHWKMTVTRKRNRGLNSTINSRARSAAYPG